MVFRAFITLVLTCSTLVSINTLAAPVEYDTPDAHIVVIRPMDQWFPDAGVEKSLDKEYFSDEYAGAYWYTDKDYVSLRSDEPLAILFRSKNPNKSPALWRMSISTRKPIPVQPSQMAQFIKAQNEFYGLSVIARGNPMTLPNRLRTNAIWRDVLTIATIGIGGAVGGGNLAAAVAGSSIPSQFGALALDAQQGIVGVKPLNLDYSKYKAIDLHRVDGGGVGQIIIAYKTEKTPAIENEALAIAIGSTLGFDTTKEATLAARAADLADRQAIWDKCVADGKCKED